MKKENKQWKIKKYLVELDEILNQLNEEDLSKIPVDIRNAITEKKDNQ